MTAALFALISNIIFFALNYPLLALNLTEKGLPISFVIIFIDFVDVLTMGLNVTSAVFLFLGIYYVYKTHKAPKVNLS